MSGVFYVNFLPSVVSTLVHSGSFNEVQAGQIVAFNGYGSLIGSTVAVFMVRVVAWRSVISLSLLIMAAIDLSTIWIDSYSTMLAWRFGSGIVGGVIVGIAFSVIARLKDPDRGFALLIFLQFACGSMVIYLLPNDETGSAHQVVFAVMGGCALLALLLVCLLPALVLRNNQFLTRQRTTGKKAASCLLLLAIVLYLAAANAIWAYVGLIGKQTLLESERINTYIACTGLLGLLGALWPVINSNRYGRLNWVVTAVGMSVISAVMLSFSNIPLMFIGAMALLFFAWPAVHSYLLAASAQLDSSGKLSAISAVISYLGLASGPMFGASLLEQGSFSTMLYACAATFFLSLIASIKPLKRCE
ncbi:hypothetical protein PA25_14760 [Pseudoalteromonas sp. A25]|nr:hypothetical protein PA25_14760 [Pseudoalteromonas sp. A25]